MSTVRELTNIILSRYKLKGRKYKLECLSLLCNFPITKFTALKLWFQGPNSFYDNHLKVQKVDLYRLFSKPEPEEFFQSQVSFWIVSYSHDKRIPISSHTYTINNGIPT